MVACMHACPVIEQEDIWTNFGIVTCLFLVHSFDGFTTLHILGILSLFMPVWNKSKDYIAL